MSAKPGAAAAPTGNERKTWDKAEYAEKARQKDAEYAERAKERAEAMKSGKKVRRKVEMPKATKLLEARDAPLQLDKNVNKTMIVASGRPGFSCETCRRTLKDSASYLDHVNGRFHLRMLGQMTKVQRSTLQEVQAKIEELRELTRKKLEAKQYDFEQRLKELRDLEEETKQQQKERRKAAKEQAQEESKKQLEAGVDQDMASMMGFSGFS